MNDLILKTNDLSKRYGDQLAVDGVSLKVYYAEDDYRTDKAHGGANLF